MHASYSTFVCKCIDQSFFSDQMQLDQPSTWSCECQPQKMTGFCTLANKFWGCGGITDRQTWDWSCVHKSKLRRLIIHKLHEKESSNTQSSCCLQIKRSGCEFGKLQMQAHLGKAGPKHINWHCCTLQNFLPVLTHWVSLVTTSAHCLPSHIETQAAFGEN